MKALVTKMTACIGLVLSLGACRENEVVSPNEPIAEIAHATNDVILPTIPKNYKITKFGEANLTYYNDGRLHTVTQPNYSREYTYNGNTIKATSYIDGKKALEDTYLIDPATKRCYESTQVDYFLSGVSMYPIIFGAPSQTSVWKYEYNAQGQLKTITRKNSPSTRTDLVYNANGDLIRTGTFVNYMKNGVETTADERYYFTFTYSLNGSQRSPGPNQISPVQYLDDQYSMNSHWVHLPNVYGLDTWGQPIPERYLAIFGKQSKHLLMSFTRNYPNEPNYKTGAYYSYKLNADGYVTERKDYNTYNDNLLETKPYDYLVTNIGVQF